MKNKVFSPETKFRAVLSLERGERTALELSKEIDCHPRAVYGWRDHFIKNGCGIFSSPRNEEENKKKLAEYERLIGKLTVQLDFSKKVYESARLR